MALHARQALGPVLILAVVGCEASSAASAPAKPAKAVAPADTRPSFSVVRVAKDDVLNLRERPDSRAAIVKKLAPDAVGLRATGRLRAVGKAVWREVDVEGHRGWVHGRYVQRAAKGGLAGLEHGFDCFGTEPFWRLQIGRDAVARCSQDCPLAAQLRVADPRFDGAGERWSLTLAEPELGQFLSVTIDGTGKCEDGMSDRLYSYEFKGAGVGQNMRGCCRIAGLKAVSELD